MHDWCCDHETLVYDHVRSLCDLKSQLRSFEQLAATDFACMIVHDHPQQSDMIMWLHMLMGVYMFVCTIINPIV